MDVATALTVAQTLFATLQCAEVRKLCSICNYESELQKLLDTVKTIKTFLLDADSKCLELNNEGQNWVENLKDAVYDAADLMDEFNTIAQQLQKMPGGKIHKKVHLFFSNNQILSAVNTSGEIKKLREKLASLAKNHSDFGFSELYKPVKSREETCSFVYEQIIIGRDADKDATVELLLNDDLERNISFVTVVGIGGLGKTTLAQLVFNDLRIREAFEDKYWVCVSENFSMKDILGKIMDGEVENEFEDLYMKVREHIEGKKYLLVLDDVWSENSEKWDELKNFLNLGGRGSRILVTSRSKKVAGSIGNYPIHELQGLSKEDSWELFKKISLGDREDEYVTSLVEIGKDIVRKCANVPLSIRVVASLLHGQDIITWQSYRRVDLAKMHDNEDDLMQTLMFSYYHLDPAIKTCFSFCSVFPQGTEIDKEMLISLWSAHGYLVPSLPIDNSIEDVGERYFSILLQRCFFQDFKEDDGVESVKMHDLIHDLARKVAGKESLTLTACSTQPEVEGKVRHLLSDSSKNLDSWLSSSNSPSKNLRTCLIYQHSETSLVHTIISKCRRLRVLYCSLRIRTLPDTLGGLVHLRYLNISGNRYLEMLPKSITKLHYLQTLILRGCKNLRELPEDTSNLVNLRVLDITECPRLTYMPAGMGKLKSLHTLPMFLVEVGDDEVNQDKKGRLIDLIPIINNLRGHLTVVPNETFDGHVTVEVKLDSLHICILGDAADRKYFNIKEAQKTFLEMLLSNSKPQMLCIHNYPYTEMPSWATGLVNISLDSCNELQYLPSSLSQLRHLKYLHLEDMKSLEYIESDAPSPSANFFPCLENLQLSLMPKLKGWWRDIPSCMEKETVFIPSFPRLCELYIDRCLKLTYIPQYPHVKKVVIRRVNEALTFYKKEGGVESNPIYLNTLEIDDSCVFNSLGVEFVGSDSFMELYSVKDLGHFREGFQSATSLRFLKIIYCEGLENLEVEHLTNLKSPKLESNLEGTPYRYLQSLEYLFIKNCPAVVLPKGIQYLTSLQSLHITNFDKLEHLGECINTLTSLQHLELSWCRKLKSLPDGMRYLTSLTTLEISDCVELKSLPEEIRHLTSLTTLEIRHCDSLKSLPEEMRHLTSLTTLRLISPSLELRVRCQRSDGEDWPKICHIPDLYIEN